MVANNPYKTPRSALADQSKQKPKKVFWKLYFLLFMALVIADTYLKLQQPDINLWEALSFLANLTVMAGLYTFSFNREPKMRWVWRVLFLFILLEAMPLYYRTLSESVIEGLVFIVIVGPAYFNFFRVAWLYDSSNSA